VVLNQCRFNNHCKPYASHTKRSSNLAFKQIKFTFLLICQMPTWWTFTFSYLCSGTKFLLSSNAYHTIYWRSVQQFNWFVDQQVNEQHNRVKQSSSDRNSKLRFTVVLNRKQFQFVFHLCSKISVGYNDTTWWTCHQ